MTKEKIACKKKSLDLLARREHSVLELTSKLLERDFSEDLVANVLDSLVEEGILNDERYAKEFLYFKSAKGQGPVKIKSQLQQKGIKSQSIDAVIEGSDQDWIALAKQVLDKRFGKEVINDTKEYARRSRYLVSRGFKAEHILNVLGSPYE